MEDSPRKHKCGSCSQTTSSFCFIDTSCASISFLPSILAVLLSTQQSSVLDPQKTFEEAPKLIALCLVLHLESRAFFEAFETLIQQHHPERFGFELPALELSPQELTSTLEYQK